MSAFAIGADRWPGISKLMEETAEVVQVCSKLLATYGDVMHWDGSNLRDRLEEELGDALAAIDFVLMLCPLDAQRVMERRASKLKLFQQWHREQRSGGTGESKD